MFVNWILFRYSSYYSIFFFYFCRILSVDIIWVSYSENLLSSYLLKIITASKQITKLNHRMLMTDSKWLGSQCLGATGQMVLLGTYLVAESTPYRRLFCAHKLDWLLAFTYREWNLVWQRSKNRKQETDRQEQNRFSERRAFPTEASESWEKRSRANPPRFLHQNSAYEIPGVRLERSENKESGVPPQMRSRSCYKINA